VSESATAVAVLTIASLPAVGQPLEGGIFAGVITTKEGTHCAVVLLADKPGARLPWKKAMTWAAQVGGRLPSRPVAAMLFANLQEQFEAAWHWTSDEFDGSCAWGCSFSNGSQDGTHKSFEGCARAVRLIHLGA
jgi:hypothetical protein